MVVRGDVCSVFANNIMAGNLTSPCTNVMVNPEYERQDGFLNMGGSKGTLANNIIEGSIKEKINITEQNQTYMPAGFDLGTILTSGYKPVGPAVGTGTLGSITYSGKKSGPYTLDVMKLLEDYPVDLAGTPRVTGGKVNIGCFQAKQFDNLRMDSCIFLKNSYLSRLKQTNYSIYKPIITVLP